jgi:hypothetical protein
MSKYLVGLSQQHGGAVYNLKLTYLEIVYAKVFIWNRLLTTSGSAVVMSIVMILLRLPPSWL